MALISRSTVSLYKRRKLINSVQIKMAEKFRKAATRIGISALGLIKS